MATKKKQPEQDLDVLVDEPDELEPDDAEPEEIDDEELDLEEDDDVDEVADATIPDELEDTAESDDYEDDDDDEDEEHDEETADALEELESQELQLLEDEANEAMLVDEVEELRAMRRAELTLSVDAQARRSDEFVCQSCFMVKRLSQLANKRKMFCQDCVA